LTTPLRYDAPRSGLHRLTTDIDSLTGQYNSFILNARIELSPATVNDYSFKLRAFVNYCLEADITRVTDVTTDHIRGFIASMQMSHGPKSVNGYYKVVRRFFSWLFEEDRLSVNPMARIKSPRVPVKVIKIFNEEHLRKILLLCEDGTHTGVRNKAMVLTLLDTGIRLSELTRIQVNDIDVQRGIIIVMGKGARERVVGISKSTLKAIIAYYQQSARGVMNSSGLPRKAGR